MLWRQADFVAESLVTTFEETISNAEVFSDFFKILTSLAYSYLLLPSATKDKMRKDSTLNTAWLYCFPPA